MGASDGGCNCGPDCVCKQKKRSLAGLWILVVLMLLAVGGSLVALYNTNRQLGQTRDQQKGAQATSEQLKQSLSAAEQSLAGCTAHMKADSLALKAAQQDLIDMRESGEMDKKLLEEAMVEIKSLRKQ